MRFGLYAVGTDAAKTRTPRSAVKTYAEIIKAQAISAELLKKFPPE
jgi:beta-glucosidase/6-phospho-beta-glucosidase/beta-galactosidase